MSVVSFGGRPDRPLRGDEEASGDVQPRRVLRRGDPGKVRRWLRGVEAAGDVDRGNRGVRVEDRVRSPVGQDIRCGVRTAVRDQAPGQQTRGGGVVGMGGDDVP